MKLEQTLVGIAKPSDGFSFPVMFWCNRGDLAMHSVGLVRYVNSRFTLKSVRSSPMSTRMRLKRSLFSLFDSRADASLDC